MKVFRESYNNWKIEFVYSPFFEMLCSLHVLYRPEHHLRRLKWAEELKESLGIELLNSLNYFGKYYFEWCSAMDFCQIDDRVNGLMDVY